MKPLPDLLALLSASPGPTAISRPNELVDAAARHGLSGVIAASASMSSALPEVLRARLLADARGLAGQTLKTRTLLFRTLDALERAKVKPALLKGYGLGARIYADPLARPSTDVDLLVHPTDWDGAVQALERSGLQPVQSAPAHEKRAQHHHFEFQGALGTVELHFRPIAAFGSALGWSALRPLREEQLSGRSVHYLQPEDELVYLALHAAQHLFSRLWWIYDLKRFVEVYSSLDWQRVAALGSQLRFRTPLWCALDCAFRCFAAPIPSSALSSLRPRGVRAKVLRALFSPRRIHRGLYAEGKWTPGAVRLAMTDGAFRRGLLVVQSFARLGRRRVYFSNSST